jgi:thiosulfate/3-mercaptopyruvate sulfurtransferase
MTNAARVWFILQYYGLKAVIVNGGWPMLCRNDRTTAGSSGLVRPLPRGAGLRTGRAG